MTGIASLRMTLREFIENNPSIHGFHVRDAMTASRLRAQQIQSLLRYTPYMLLANVLNALIFMLSFRNSAYGEWARAFALPLSAAVGVLYLRWKNMQGEPQRALASARAPRRAFVNALILGSIWAIPPLFFVDPALPGTNLVVTSLSVGMICGGAFALAAVPAAAAGFVFPITFGMMIGVTSRGVDFGFELTSLLVVFLFVIVKSSLALSAMIAERLLGQFELEKQRETIGILLGEFEENASDWLWETDVAGNFVYLSQGFYKAIGSNEKSATDASAYQVLSRQILSTQGGDPSLPTLKDHWESRLPFRDVEIGLRTEAGLRWWSITGRPVYDHAQEFQGYRGFCADITLRRENAERISHLARHDSVTGLPNRVLFNEQLGIAISGTYAGADPFSIFYIDLDGFKEVNDTFGHAIGDKLLREVSQRISECAGPGGRAARLGGDEFAVIQTDAGLLADAGAFAEYLIAEISHPYAIDGFSIHIGASAGVVCAPQHGADPERLLINADLALYRAKASGKGTWRLFEASMDAEARARRSLEVDMRAAISNGGFRLVFQPLVSLSDRTVTSCEALIRWNHPLRGDVPPAEFIPLAEETGLIFEIGEWVIEEACRIASTWPHHIPVAINLSPAQFHSQGLLTAIRKSLSRHHLPPQRLEIEVTESVLVSNVERVQLVLGALGAMGVRIALDDFGTGYSSLGYIRQIRFDKIKIDRSFVSELSTDPKCAAIVRAVIALARDTGMRVTAEGVETEEQLAFLERESCSEAQGYYFSRPLEAADVPGLFGTRIEGRCDIAA